MATKNEGSGGINQPVGNDPIDMPSADKPEAEHISPELDKKLDELKNRALAAKSVYETHSKPAEKAIQESAGSRSSYRGLGYGLSIAYTIVGAPAAGLIVGLIIEKQTGQVGWSGWLTIIMACVGLWLVIIKSNRQNELDELDAKAARANQAKKEASKKKSDGENLKGS